MAQIFSEAFERLRLPFEASLLKKYGQGTFSEKLASALTEGGQIIAFMIAEKHWVPAHGMTQPCFKVDDPDQTAVPRGRVIRNRGHKGPSDQELVLLPLNTIGDAS